MSEQPTAGGTGTARCPACRARVVPGQQWCTLCHGRLGEPEAPPAEEARPTAPGGPGVSGGSTVDPPAVLPPGMAEAMLAELAATTDRPLSRGPLAGRSRAVRIGLGVSAALVLMGIGVGLLALIGLLL